MTPVWPFEKLVRRHVPDQLRARGEKIETRIAKPEEMLRLLRDKLIEEVSELVEAIDAGSEKQIIEELADVREVIAAFASPHLVITTGSRRGLWIGNEATARQFDKMTEKGNFTDIVMKLDEPEPRILHCPKCGEKHVDKGILGDDPCSPYSCHACGELWRPFNHATVGVEDVATYKLAGSGAVIGGGAL